MPISHTLTRFVDLFYIEPLHRIVPRQTFRYIVCGGINFVVTIVCYAVAYNFIFAGRPVGGISAHIASLGISLPVNFFTGFWLQSKISFRRSPLRRRVQFVRYLATALVALSMTWLLTLLLVDVCGVWPTPAQVIIYCITAVFSFVSQKYFTFRGAERE